MTKPIRRLTAEDYAVDAVTAAKALVGAWLCRRLDDGTVMRRRITETEAYCGEEDTACHAHKGRTARTDVMYSPGGCAYIYLCYGMHELLNIVTGPEGRPEAVLIRGVEALQTEKAGSPEQANMLTRAGHKLASLIGDNLSTVSARARHCQTCSRKVARLRNDDYNLHMVGEKYVHIAVANLHIKWYCMCNSTRGLRPSRRRRCRRRSASKRRY